MSSLIFDAHLDLSMNAMEWNRDLTRPLEEIRERENGMNDKPDRGNGTVSFSEMRKGNIGVCVATLIARFVKPASALEGWNSQEQAWSQTQGQLSWYKAMENRRELIQINNADSLKAQVEKWKNKHEEKLPIGYVLSLEGADSIINMHYLEKAYQSGLRAIGPAHYGPAILWIGYSKRF